MKHQVKIEPLGIICEVSHDTSLHDVLGAYSIEFPCGGKGICGNCKVRLLQGTIVLDENHAHWLQRKGLDNTWRLACLSHVTEDICISIRQCEQLILTDNSSFDFQPETGYGIAVDLGSTTIVSQLVNMTNGQVEGVCTDINPQSSYGADIISRISYAMLSTEHNIYLRNLVRECIYNQILHLISQQTVNLRKVVIVGNSVMHHLFCGIDAAPLATFPFQSVDNAGRIYSPEALGWNLMACSIEFLPNISHFVGSDIIAGIQATRLFSEERFQALLDLGTNGEIVIGNKDRIICTSTAVGPAFEGVHISQGMRAANGAICSVEVVGGELHCRVIGNEQSVGICGSGLVEAVCCLLETDKIDFTGAVTADDDSALILCDNVNITQEDIREFQLAKAAVCTGFQLLRKQLPVSMSDIERIYIAGGMGNYLNIMKACKVGLLELASNSQVVRLNNSALMGAKQLLFDVYRNQVDSWVGRIEYCSLETLPGFQDVYCENLFFPLT